MDKWSFSSRAMTYCVQSEMQLIACTLFQFQFGSWQKRKNLSLDDARVIKVISIHAMKISKLLMSDSVNKNIVSLFRWSRPRPHLFGETQSQLLNWSGLVFVADAGHADYIS